MSAGFFSLIELLAHYAGGAGFFYDQMQGVIVNFTAGQALLMVIAWALGVFGWGRFVLPKLVRALGEAIGHVWFPAGLPMRPHGDSSRLGRLIPARCPVRSGVASQQPSPEPPDRGESLRGWPGNDR